MKKTWMILALCFASSAALACEKMKVSGLHCSDCKDSIEAAFRAMPEVEKADVDMKTSVLSVKYKDGKTLSEQAMTDALKTSGFKAAGCQDLAAKKAPAKKGT